MPWPLGKKQPRSMWLKRRKTCIARYGVVNVALAEHVRKKISITQKGVSKPRTKEHQRNIMRSRKRNGTLSPTLETRVKISKTLRDLFARGKLEPTIPLNNNYVHGVYKGLHYRSTWEKEFLRQCARYGIDVKSAENKKFRVRYTDDRGKERWYYPDFYLPKNKVVVEIKAMWNFGTRITEAKFAQASKRFSFVVVTEEELDDPDFYQYLKESG